MFLFVRLEAWERARLGPPSVVHCRPQWSKRGWQAVATAANSVVVARFCVYFGEPSEEGGGGLDGDALALLLGQVFTAGPPVEGVLGDQVAVVEGIEQMHQNAFWVL